MSVPLLGLTAYRYLTRGHVLSERTVEAYVSAGARVVATWPVRAALSGTATTPRDGPPSETGLGVSMALIMVRLLTGPPGPFNAPRVRPRPLSNRRPLRRARTVAGGVLLSCRA